MCFADIGSIAIIRVRLCVCLYVCLFVCLSICPHDRTKTTETTVTKLATGIVHRESWMPIITSKSLMKLFKSLNLDLINECRFCFNFSLPSMGGSRWGAGGGQLPPCPRPAPPSCPPIFGWTSLWCPMMKWTKSNAFRTLTQRPVKWQWHWPQYRTSMDKRCMVTVSWPCGVFSLRCCCFSCYYILCYL